MDDLNIPNNKINTITQKLNIPGKDQIMRSTIPTIPKQTPDLFAQFKSTNPNLILSSFGIPFLQTEIYKGKIPIAIRDEPITTRKTKIGTSIFSDLQFTSINGTEHVPVDTVLYDVHQAKNIVKTDIQGRDGSIKEYIGLADYEVSIKGIICGDNGVYPWDHVLNLIQFLRYDQSVGIVSRYLNEVFDINELVIYDFKFEQPESSQSYQKFTIDAWSEKPVEILIQEGK